MRIWHWVGIGIGASAHLGCSSGEQPKPGMLPSGDTTSTSTTSSTSQGVVNAIGASIGIGNTIGGSTTGDAVDPCKTADCADGQRCENQGGAAVCVDLSCEELACDDTELCISIDGGGHACREKCTSDAACTEDMYCDVATGECVADACTPDTRSCGADDTVRVCDSNGMLGAPISCGSAGYFASQCSVDAAGSGACTCEDDWDCPAFMTCESGLCAGTGFAPTCTLPATPFSEVLPEVEFRWGEGTTHSYLDNPDDDANDDAVGKAFPWSSQVSSPPIVLNLDDDNGDGRADELDFPEIVFLTHEGDNRDTDGILRAVHGGGPSKGQDFFAICGNPARPATPAASYADADGAYWSEGEAVPDACGTSEDHHSAGLARGVGAPAAGDLDGDGFPEIVLALETGGFQILSNRGEVLFTSPINVFEPAMTTYNAPSPALSNLDFSGMPEIVIGNRVVSLTKDAAGAFAIDKVYVASSGALGAQNQNMFVYGPSVCVADLTSATGMEIVAGPTLYRLPDSPPADCGDVATPCELEVVWNAQASLAMAQSDGLCAVADVLGTCSSESDCAANPPGPQHPLDGKAEVVLVANGHLVILDGGSGTLLLDQDLGGGDSGGAPNIDDFDGDGFPEIATALSAFYQVIDLQAPDATSCPAWDDELDTQNPPPQTNPARDAGGGSCTQDADCTVPGTVCNEISETCVCLHNGWKRITEDDSSRVTSSSVFDFNGDGAAEVAYGDECYFRIYDGATGGVYLALPSVSRTILENPVVADVDNDGNAEIVFVQNNSFEQCGEGDTDLDGWQGDLLNQWPTGTVAKDTLPSGVTVLGDSTDTWVSARRVWNQHSYHVTNVLESGAIPLHEPSSWLPLNGRFYNTYRSQPRSYGVAPDLTVTAIQVSSPDARCGELSEEIEISVVIKNAGDLRVGPGVAVVFYGAWDAGEEPLNDAAGMPIVVVLDKSLEPGASTLVTISYSAGDNTDPSLPDSVRITVDGGNASADGTERECNEDNNELTADVDAGEALADLALVIDSATCGGDVEVTVTNNGADTATGVVVRVYAGDPSAGGKVLGEATLDELAADATESLSIDVGNQMRNVTIWVVVDPDDSIAECNDANNIAEGPALVCAIPA